MSALRGRYGESGDLTPDWQAIVTSTILPDCRALNVPFVCGIDGRRLTTDVWDWAANECATRGVYFVPSWQAFPIRGVADAVAYDAARSETAAPYATQLGVHTWLACYTGLGAWPVQTVCDTAAALWPVIAQRRQWGVSLFTRWGRVGADGQPLDGPQKYPELLTLMHRLVAAATQPETWPLPALTSLEVPVSNPTDAITYDQFLARMRAIQAACNADPKNPNGHVADDNGGAGVFFAYRMLAEGTPDAAIIAGQSAPTQTPQPTIPYATVYDVLRPMLVGARSSKGDGIGYLDLATDIFRVFGGERARWGLAAIFKAITGTDATALFR